jgi:hypothetical protein
MRRVKPGYNLVIALAIFIATALAGWALWGSAVRWLNSPTAGTSDRAPLQNVVLPPIPAAREATAHQQGVEDFIGTWTGKWDGTYAMRLTMTPANGRSLSVVYEHEEVPGQPMVTKMLHPTPNGRVAKMPRGGMVMTLSETQPNTARADGNFDLGSSYHHTATLVRTPPDAAAVDWLAGAGTGPIVLDIKANIDGCDVLHLSQTGAKWEHRLFQWPSDVSVNGNAWDITAQPTLSKTGLDDADFLSAKIVNRSGRDIIAMENSTRGLDIYFDDGPPGADAYEIQIAMNRKSDARAPVKPVAEKTIFLDISADIDGSDVMTISPDGARWRHRTARWAANVKVNGKAWDVQDQPLLAELGLNDADLGSAEVVQRSGRGLILMEKGANEITIFFSDGMPGAGPYRVQLRFAKK